jgi:hypothetical protein
LLVVGSDDLERLPKALAQGEALRVGPPGIDDESVGLPFLERGTGILARLQAALDAARIEQQREPGA